MLRAPRRSGALRCLSTAVVLSAAFASEIRADEPVVWTNVVGASASGNTITKTTSADAYDAGGASVNVIRDGSGYVEFSAIETNTYRMAGLGHGDADQGSGDVDFGILLGANQDMYVFEGGNYRGYFGTYAAGDRFRVEVQYGVIRYRKNGVVFLASGSPPPTYPLRVDVSLRSPGSTIGDARIGNLAWANEVGVTVSGSSLNKAGAAGWTSGAISANSIEAADGAMEFTATETNTTRAAGLSRGDTNQDVSYQVNATGSAKTFTYDANGDLTGDGDRTFEWDGANRLTAVNIGAHRSEFSYDGRDHRVRIVEKNNGVTTSDRRFLWCGPGICEERDATGAAVVRRYFSQGFEEAGAAFFYTTDHLGSVRELTDVTGALRARYDYDPFGRATKLAGDKNSVFQFAGQISHPASGLQLAAFRAYDASLGRWISPDPIDLLGGINRYAYVVGNPTDLTDPLGLQLPVPPVDPATIGYDAAITFFFIVSLMRATDPPAVPTSSPPSGPPTGMPPAPTTTGAPATPVPPPDPQGSSSGGTPLSPEEEAQMKAEHAAYSKRCSESAPAKLCECERLRWELQRNIDCLNGMKAWDEKWGARIGQRARHAESIANLERGISNLRTQIQERCGGQ
jgi:RHS repeat-associated protein